MTGKPCKPTTVYFPSYGMFGALPEACYVYCRSVCYVRDLAISLVMSSPAMAATCHEVCSNVVPSLCCLYARTHSMVPLRKDVTIQGCLLANFLRSSIPTSSINVSKHSLSVACLPASRARDSTVQFLSPIFFLDNQFPIPCAHCPNLRPSRI